MNSQVLVWDLETIPDLSCVSRVHNLSPEDETAAREVLGDKFPKLPFCKIVCVGALRAERTEFGYQVRSLGAPHSGERSEPELIQTFAEKIHELQPKLVTYNGGSFDLPVLRYRAMINRITAPGLECRRYWYRYSDDCLDLCDALACYTPGAKVSLDHLSRALGFPGKPGDIDGSQVERMVQEGRIAEVAAYCETDVVRTYRIWLVYELFRGALSKSEFNESEWNLVKFVRDRLNSKPHLQYLVPSENLVSPATAIEPVLASAQF